MPDVPLYTGSTTLSFPDGTEVDLGLSISLAITIGEVRPPEPPPSGPGVRAVTQGNGSTVSLPPNEAGDLLLYIGAVPSNPSGFAPTGYTVIASRNEAAGGGWVVAFWKVSTGGESTVPVIQTPFLWTTYAFQNAAGIDTFSTSGAGSGTAVTFPSVDPTVAPTVLVDIALIENEDGATTITMPAGETPTTVVTAVSSPYFMGTGYKTLDSDAPTGTRSGTLDAVGAKAPITVVVK